MMFGLVLWGVIATGLAGAFLVAATLEHRSANRCHEQWCEEWNRANVADRERIALSRNLSASAEERDKLRTMLAELKPERDQLELDLRKIRDLIDERIGTTATFTSG